MEETYWLIFLGHPVSILIPGRNQNRLKVLRQGSGDKRTVAFGASENSRPMDGISKKSWVIKVDV